jgi:GNAT superfamily N-acetyltransferase
MQITLRTPLPQDLAAIAGLISHQLWRYGRFNFTAEGRRRALRDHAAGAVGHRAGRNGISLAAVDGDHLAGFVEIRDEIHLSRLSQLFVQDAYRHRGVDQALLREAVRQLRQRHPDRHRLTLHALPYDVPRYVPLGFVCTGTRVTQPNGVTYQPMAFALN